MITRLKPARFLAAALVVLLLLSGCGSTGVRESSGSRTSPQAQAEQMARQGNYAGAAALYESAASSASGTERTELLLAAVHQYLLARNTQSAERLFSGIDRPLARPLATEYRIVAGELRVAQGRYQEAYDALGPQPDSYLALDLRARYYAALADALSGLGQTVYEADARMQLADFVADSNLRAYNQQHLIALLARMPEDQRAEILRRDHPYAAGWIALADAMYNSGTDREAAVAEWRRTHPNHPAAANPDAQPYGYGGPMVYSTNASTAVGVLLPFTGAYSKGAGALREGITAALYSLPPERRPALRFYDTGVQTDILSAYNQAVNEGAQYVLGPLTKEGVSALKLSGDLRTPVLALNQTEEPTPGNMLQFALLPEEEGRQVADRAAREGLRSAAVLYPSTGTDNRYLDGFRAQWESIGGVLTAAVPYDPEQHDFGETVRSLVRSNPDFVYIIARPLKARQLRTQIQFFGAATTPVFVSFQALQDMMPGSTNPDLEGARIPGMKWLLAGPAEPSPVPEAGPAPAAPPAPLPVGLSISTATAGTLPAAPDQRLNAVYDGITSVERGYANFFAMGFDALLIAADPSVITSAFGGFDGITGRLSINSGGMIHREPTWLTFSNGRPQLLPDY